MMDFIGELVDLAKSSSMSKKHAAAVFMGRQLISTSTNIQLQPSEESYRSKRCEKEG